MKWISKGSVQWLTTVAADDDDLSMRFRIYILRFAIDFYLYLETKIPFEKTMTGSARGCELKQNERKQTYARKTWKM